MRIEMACLDDFYPIASKKEKTTKTTYSSYYYYRLGSLYQ